MGKIYLDEYKLKEHLRTNNIFKTALHFGVSKNTIARRIKEWNIDVWECKDNALPSELTVRQQNIINGCLLGDGCIPHLKKRNNRFKFKQADCNLPYVEHVKNCLFPYSMDIKKDGDARYFYTKPHPIFTTLRERWYIEPNNTYAKKIIPKDLKLNWEIISYWYADDGCNDIGSKGVFLYTNCFDKLEVMFLIDALRQFGIHSSLIWHYSKKYDKKYPVIRVKRKSYFDFIDGVKLYLSDINCLQYKLDVISAGHRDVYNQVRMPTKLSSDQVLEAVNLYQNRVMPVVEIAKKLNVSVSTIERCVYSLFFNPNNTRHYGKKLTPIKKKLIILDWESGDYTQLELALKNGVSQSLISLIVKNINSERNEDN